MIDISVAVATESGLITPIIKDADKKGIAAIALEVKELVSKSKENKLKPDQYQVVFPFKLTVKGGTFTISNLGMYGIKNFTAIINPPQSCILAVGTTERRPMSTDGDGFKFANVMTVTLSCDHRVVDGAAGAAWLQHLKRCLEDPLSMLI